MANHYFHDVIEALAKAKTAEELRSICSRLCDHFGFDRFIYGARIPASSIEPCLIVSGYPKEWLDRYMAHQYTDIDPAVIHCARSLTPIVWEDITPNCTRGGFRVMTEAREFGLKSGVSFPVHSAQGDFAILSLVSSDEHAKTKQLVLDTLPWGQLFAAHLHQAACRVFHGPTVPTA